MTATDAYSPDKRVLLLPATRRDADVVCAFLEKEAIECFICTSSAQVANELETGAASVILTDAAMAGVAGIRIVEALRNQPPWSDVPVVLLRKADAPPEVENLIERITNVTVLERPTSRRTLVSAVRTSLRARIRQYELRDQVEALRHAENALRQADRRKDEFLAMLAHELRNPLAPIRSAMRLLPLILTAGDERVEPTLRMMDRQISQLSRLVDDLLDVSRITEGRIELQREVLDLSSVVSQALESVEPLITEKGHVVEHQDAARALHVQGDRARLVQCVSNLLANSAKYTDAGGKIRIETRREGEQAVVAVADTGIGMSEELLPKIFDLFVQSERSLDRAQGGLGIGLSVVRQLVAMHHGEISAHSAGVGKGSTFEIRLPLVSAPADVVPAAARAPGRSKRVLIVDDNQDAADALSMLLQIEGHDVQTAYGAEKALETAASHPPDFVLLDIGLPTMDGYEVARRLRSSGVSAQLVALTGYGQPGDVQRAREAGFDNHMVKPVDFDRLLEALDA